MMIERCLYFTCEDAVFIYLLFVFYESSLDPSAPEINRRYCLRKSKRANMRRGKTGSAGWDHNNHFRGCIYIFYGILSWKWAVKGCETAFLRMACVSNIYIVDGRRMRDVSGAMSC